MQFVFDYPFVTALVCCSVLIMLGITWKVRQWKDMFSFFAVSWLALVGILIAGIYSVDHAASVTKEGLQDSLSGLAKSFAVALKDAGHEKITLETPDDDPLYEQLLSTMHSWQSHIPIAASIYTFRKNAEGKIVFICCPPADLNRDGKYEGEDEVRVPKGEIYEYESEDDIAEILDAFAGKSGFNDAPASDEWGLWITAAEPIFDASDEHIDAVLGVDFWGEKWNANVRRAVFWTEMFLLLSVTLFFSVQIFTIRRRIIDNTLTQYTADLERTMDELVEAKKNAEIAVQAKSFFLANISHEIRTPMSAILGCVDMLIGAREGKKGTLNQEQLVDIIQKSSKNLSTIIDDVLTLASIETNRIMLESVPIDLRQLVEDVRIMASSSLEEKPQIQFRTEWGNSVPRIIMGDPARLRQMLLALISNAIKFTETGHITVRCSGIMPSDEAEYAETTYSSSSPSHASSVPFLSPHIAHAKGLRGMVCVSAEQAGLQTSTRSTLDWETWRSLPSMLLLRIDVSDTGIGIDKERFSTLFKPFCQVDDSSTRRFGGVGLGLSIVKGFAELMEGDVRVVSKPGQGSTFSVFIPVSEHEDLSAWRKKQLSPSQIRTQLESSPLQGYHVLAVDDVAVNRIVVETRLRDMGAKVQSASNGKIAVDLVLGTEESELPFDFILMDLQMPVMDGFEATRTLRQRGFTKPIVALTANRDSDQEAIAAGCNLILSKPADREILYKTIIGLVQKTGNTAR